MARLTERVLLSDFSEMDELPSAMNTQQNQCTLPVFHGADAMPMRHSYLDVFPDLPNSVGREIKTRVSWETSAFQSIVSGNPFGAAVPRRRKRFPLSYVGVVATTILASPRHQLTLAEIYQGIEARFPEFTANRVGWKNTVRHNLSLHDCFIKGELASHGRSSYWRVHPAYVSSFRRGDFRKLSKRAIDFYEKESAPNYGEVEAGGNSNAISLPFVRCRASEEERWGACLMTPRYRAFNPVSSHTNRLGSYTHLPYRVCMPYEEGV